MNQNKLKAWKLALRVKTLPASVIPVLIGGSAAYAYGHFDWGIFLLIMLCALLIQTITNFLNEIYDFKRGADTEERLGPERGVAKGTIKLSTMYIVSAVLIIITFLTGLVIVAYSDLWILLVGILSLFFAYAYTGGPYPLAYNGIADIFVFIFFGLVAVCGTFYVFTGELNWMIVIAASVHGFLSTNILGVNNFRDIDTDPKAGKMTLQVRLGKKGSIALYDILNVLAFVVPPALVIMQTSFWHFLPYLALPLGIKVSRDIKRKTGRELNNVLADTGKLLMLHGSLTSVAFLLQGLING